MVWPLVGAEIYSSTNDEVSDLVTGGATLIRSRQNHRGLKCGEDSILGATFFVLFSFDQKAVEIWTVIVQGPGAPASKYRHAPSPPTKS